MKIVRRPDVGAKDLLNCICENRQKIEQQNAVSEFPISCGYCRETRLHMNNYTGITGRWPTPTGMYTYFLESAHNANINSDYSTYWVIDTRLSRALERHALAVKIMNLGLYMEYMESLFEVIHDSE